jgi:glycerol kinase
VLGTPIDRPRSVETTALGAAYLAGLAVGVFRDTADVARAHAIERAFEPRLASSDRAMHLARWRRAVARAKSDPTTA